MSRRRTRFKDEEQELNLAPIMNMVMILIPLLLLSTVFLKTGVVNISSPRNSQNANQADTEEQEEQTPVPRVVVYISDDGFRVGDQTNLPEFQPFTTPIARCGGGGGAAAAEGQQLSPHQLAEIPPTICLREGVDANAPLLEKLDFAGLYNQLAAIRLQPQWFDRFGEENNAVISILGDPEIPFEVLIKTMDSSRYFLTAEGSGTTPPTASATIPSYQLGGGNGTRELLENAVYVFDGEGARVELFPDPVLLLPRPNTGS